MYPTQCPMNHEFFPIWLMETDIVPGPVGVWATVLLKYM